jgi:lipopolysaccharide heptosyltransferase II
MAENILILSMTRMGDMIQTTPLISGLKEKYPTAKITLLVTSDFASAVPLIPDVDESIILNLRQFDKQENWEDLSWVKIYRYLEKSVEDIKSRNFDLLVNLSHSKFSALMVRYLGIKNIVGFYCNDFGNRMTGHPWMQYFSVEVFNRKYNEFNLVEIFSRSGGVDVRGRAIEVVRSQNQLSVDTLMSFDEEDIVIGFQAGSSLEGRRWPARSFADLADMLIENLNARIIIFGVQSENKVAEEIKSLAKNKDRILNLAGKTSLSELSQLLEKCKYLVTNDTGTMHLAAALGTKIVGLFFAHAHPYETAPFSPGHLIFQARISCAPCSYGVHCNNIVCIDKVRPQHLLSAIENHIKTKTWLLPERITQGSELSVFETVFDFDMNFKLRPLVKVGLDMDDMFRTAYTLLWRERLEEKKDAGKFKFLINGVSEHLTRDYDCTTIELIDEQLQKKYLILEDIIKLGNTGKRMCGNIIRGVSGGKGNSNKIAQFGEDISCIDEKIEVLGLSNPEVRPLADMFSKRKENLVGDNVCFLAIETRKSYIDLITECDKLKEILKSCVKKLSDSRSGYISHNSINVAVPGR